MQRISTTTKVVDKFGAGKHGFTNGNVVGGVPATDLEAALFDNLQEELANVVEGVGTVLNGATLTQLKDAIDIMIRRQAGAVCTAAGTADAITGAFTPAVTALVNGSRVSARAASANATTTPTFKADGTALKTIVKGNNLALAIGDISGAGHLLQLQYDLTLDKWVLLNPASTPRSFTSVTATVAASALTLGLSPTALEFRNTPLTSGTVNARTAAAISLVVPSTATLGTLNATAARLVLLAIDNAGTVELAVANLAGGVNLDETALISTTAISAASNSASVVYSTVARASVPFRVVGFIDSTQTVAGTWAAAPSRIQGSGGQALAAMSSIGYGQTWQNLTASRAIGTTYYNTTGKPISVSVGAFNQSSLTHTLVVDGITVARNFNNAGGNTDNTLAAIVPAGSSYVVSVAGGAPVGFVTWAELR